MPDEPVPLDEKVSKLDESIRQPGQQMPPPPAAIQPGPFIPQLPGDPLWVVLCPGCGAQMQPGRVSLHPSALDWLVGLVAGLFGGGTRTGADKCWFQPHDQEEESVVFNFGETRIASHCRRCGVVAIAGKKGF